MGELGRACRDGRVTPSEIVESYLERIARLDPLVGAFVRVDGTTARKTATARTRELADGHSRGPLHGLPIVLKDLIDIEGTVTAAGSVANLSRVSAVTASAVRKLETAGMVVLGKVHTVEFAFGGWGTNPAFGTPRNPWDLDLRRVPGGSSSGAGVAVAAGLAPCAIGTDTGGSVRLPASFCGVTGLKTTKGLIDSHGIVPLSPTLDTVGPITRDAADAALLLDVLADRGPWSRPTPQAAEVSAGHVIGRLAASRLPGMQREVWDNYETALLEMERRGARIRDVPLPKDLLDLGTLSAILEAEAYALHGAAAEDAAAPMGSAVRARILKGRISAHDYLRALWQVPDRRDAFSAAVEGCAALALPTTPTTAFPVASVDETTTPATLTRFVNLLGLCALAVPTGFDDSGLPTSMQIVGRPFDEARILALGGAYQACTDWHRAIPPGF